MLNFKSVLITGTDRGLGLEFVKQFLKLQTPPKYVFAGCLDLENATEVKQLTLEHKNLRVLQLDVTDDDSIEAARVLVESQVGDAGLNLLLNNAAINNQKDGLEPLTRADMTDHFNTNTIDELCHTDILGIYTVSSAVSVLSFMSEEKLEEGVTRRQMVHVLKVVFDLVINDLIRHLPGKYSSFSFRNTASGPVMLVKTFHPLLIMASTTAADVAIVNMSSKRSNIDFAVQQKDFRYPYCSSKCALNMATVILANELRQFGIPVVCLSPGWAKTVMGGPGAKMEVSESVQRCIKIILSLEMSLTGTMMAQDGTFF